MRYFVVFNTRGIVQYEEGSPPLFLNTLIRSLDLKKPTGSRRIRDHEMEYAMCNNRIYLSIGDKEKLSERVKKLEPVLSQVPETHMVGIEEIEAHSSALAQELADKKNSARKKETLDFSSAREDTSFVEQPTLSQSVKQLNFKRAFRLFTGSIDINDLASTVKTHLIKKNIEPSYAELLTQSVISDCKREGKTHISEDAFKSEIASVVKRLIPMMNHDKFINDIKNHPGLFTICFVGVNGAGKSTSLAKITRWLLEHDLKVYIAACDTFRAGAIEQLKVHVERFKRGGQHVGFFESGYVKDDASVAQAAILKATKEYYDVLLIDTAGRMHNKENMMQSLAKLVQVNEPNHVIFVGEALLGGDSLQHIKEFNKRIGAVGVHRRINSILLTKVDTVDDKIGQVINLSFGASAPILFLGTGQSNNDLMKMDPEVIGAMLTS